MQAIKQRYRKATATRRGRIILLSILAFICAVIAAGLWYWQTNKKQILRSKIETAITGKSEGLYRVSYDDMQLDEIAGFLSISNMTLGYDSATYLRMNTTGEAPSVLINIHAPSLLIDGVKTKKALLDDEIVGRTVQILNPTIEIIYTNAGKDSARKAPTKEVYEQILGNLDLIQLDSVRITGARITTKDQKSGKVYSSFAGVNLSLLDIRVDSLGSVDSTRLLFSKEIDLAVDEVEWKAKNKLYNYKLKGISLNSASKKLDVASFNMDPTMGEEEFVRAIPTQDDRFDFSVKNVSVSNINIYRLFDEELYADAMSIGGANFKIYRDLARPRDKKNRVGDYPHQVLDNIPIPLHIARINMNGAYVEYKERSHITRKSGRVRFNNISATISNFTNMKWAIKKNNVMKVDVKSSFMNLTPLNVEWTFYLLDKNGRFNVRGHLGKVDATKLNELTEPMGPARIKEGTINSLDFNLNGHNYAMDGDVVFQYENLKVTMLEKDDDDPSKLEKARTMSFLANLIIKNDNPKRKEEVRKVTPHFDRDTNRSIFHLSWKTLFKGVRETVGIKK